MLEWNEHDREVWPKLCERLRAIARQNPSMSPDDALRTQHSQKVGPYNIWFSLELWPRTPVWHGSVSILEKIGEQDVKLALGGEESVVQVPEEGILSVSHWTEQHYQAARDLLGDVFGPILRPRDDSQQVLEQKGNFGLHWVLKADVPVVAK